MSNMLWSHLCGVWSSTPITCCMNVMSDGCGHNLYCYKMGCICMYPYTDVRWWWLPYLHCHYIYKYMYPITFWSLYKQKFNNYTPEHNTRMKYLHLDIFFGLHTINLVLPFLQFSTATNSTDNFLGVESLILSML